MDRSRVKPDPAPDPPKRRFTPRNPSRRRLVKASAKAPTPEPRRERESRKAGGKASASASRRQSRGRGRGRGRSSTPRGQAFFTALKSRATSPRAKDESKSTSTSTSTSASRLKSSVESVRDAPVSEKPEVAVDEEDRDFEEDMDVAEDDPNAPVTLDQFTSLSGGTSGPLFQTDSGPESLRAEEYERVYLFQLPTALPQLPQLSQLKLPEGTAGGTSGNGNGQRSPAGKLLVHESGRVTLTLGGCPFEVTEGMLAAFQQEVAIIDCAHKRGTEQPNELIFLGPVTHKANVIPDYEALFHIQGGVVSKAKPEN